MEISEFEDRIIKLEEFGVALGNEVLKAVRMVNDQRTVINGLMSIIDAMMTMNNISHQRILGLEQRAKGLSFEEMVDGKVLPVGPTEEHIRLMEEMADRFSKMTQAIRDTDE